MKIILILILAANAFACDEVSQTTTTAPSVKVVGEPTITVAADPGSKIYGITFDDPYKYKQIVDSLTVIGRKVTARLVFDENMAAKEYVTPAREIHKVAFVMGELLDSLYVKTLSVDQYKARTTEYLKALNGSVDIWEIGNEANGDWLGSGIAVKFYESFKLVKAAKQKTALTLYYNSTCIPKDKSFEMFAWAKKNIPADMKSGLDYVFISYYEDDCPGAKPNWPTVFRQLAGLFPNSKIGFGEVGTKAKNKKEDAKAVTARKTEYINRYYSMKISEPNYVGGYFWWYGSQDFVPSTKPLLKVFNNAIQIN